MKTLLAATLFAAGLGALPTLADAQVLTYNSPAAYAAATTGNTAYAFSGAPAGGATNEGGTYTLGPITFTGAGLNLYNDSSYGTGVNYLDEFNSPETLTLGGATALSFTLGTYNGAQSIAISINGAAATTVTESGGFPNTLFVGFTNTVPITSLTFTNTTAAGQEIDVINFQVGTNPNVVPEPSAWALLAVGTAALGLALRRRNIARA